MATQLTGRSKGNSHLPDVVVEIGGDASDAVQAIAASHAFARYNWLLGQPGKNVAGNLRGIVIDAKWRNVYNIASDVGDLLLFASLALNYMDARSRVDTIMNSNDAPDVKAQKLLLLNSSVIFRTLGGVIPGSAHLLALSLEGYVRMGGMIAGQSRTADVWAQRLQWADAKVTSSFQAVTDPDNAFTFINAYIAPRVADAIPAGIARRIP